MAFKSKFLFINEKLLPKNIFTEIKKTVILPLKKLLVSYCQVNLLLLVRFQVHLFLNEQEVNSPEVWF